MLNLIPRVVELCGTDLRHRSLSAYRSNFTDVVALQSQPELHGLNRRQIRVLSSIKSVRHSLPPGYPQRVLAAVGIGDLVASELGRQPGLNPLPPVDEIVPGAEAEDIFDSFVEAMS